MKSILNCIIYYDNYQEVSEYIIQLEQQSLNSKIKLSITVNKDTNRQAYLLKSSLIEIELNDPKDNIGYLNGLFYGFEKNIHDSDFFKWIVFSNTDIEIEDTKFFEKLLSTNYSEDTFCVAPSVYEKNNKVYENPQYYERYSAKSLKKRIFIFSQPVISKYYMKAAIYKSKIAKKEKKKSSFVYSAHGSYFMLKPKFLNEINRKYMSLLYSEEAFIAEEIRLSGGKIFYDNNIEVVHNESQTTSKLGNKRKSKLIADSLSKIYDMYFREELK